MSEAINRASRESWDDVVRQFTRFFEGLGDVEVTAESVRFSASDTGLSLSRDGSSRSFMPLHALTTRWDEVHFDDSAHEVSVVGGDGIRYTYRVPPRLIP